MAAARRRSRWVTLVVLAIVVAWLGVAAVALSSARAAAERGVTLLDGAEITGGNPVQLVSSSDRDGQVEDAESALDAAGEEFSSTATTMRSPVLAPLKLLPFVGRQLRSVTAVAEGAEEVTDAASSALDQLNELADRPTSSPADRTAAVADSLAILRELQSRLDAIDLGPSEALVGPVQQARDRFADQLDQTRDTLDTAVTGLVGVDALLRGPSTYLVLAANNAEMRAGSGMFLQAGEMTIDGGTFELTEFERTLDLYLDQPGAQMDPDMAARWGTFEPNQEWRNLNLSPRFDESARMAADMWVASGHAPVDGVIAVDLVAVQRLLQLTGPVEVIEPDGTVTTYSADSLLSQLALEQYLGGDDQDVRRDRLGEVVDAVFTAFNERGVSAADLMALIDEAGAQRHLLMWSSDPAQQDAWEALGVSGVLPADALMATLMNRGANKLDPYVAVAADLTATEQDDHWRVSVTVLITNSAPAGLPRYVAGPVEGIDAGAGEYVGIMSLTVPASATAPTTTGDGFVVLGDDGPTRVLGSNVKVPAGQQRSLTFEFDLPSAADVVQVFPSARVPPVQWTAGSTTWTEGRPRTVALGSLG